MFFSTAITVAAFVPLFTMQGVEGQIFSPMARTYGYALVGALIATFTVTPVLASLLLPSTSRKSRRSSCARCAGYTPVLRWSLATARSPSRSARSFLLVSGFLGSRLGSEFLPALEEGNLWIRASMPPTMGLEAGMPIVNRENARDLLRHPEVITVVSQHGRPDNGSDAAGFSNAEFFVPLKPFDEWPRGYDQGRS
jgi:heavy metal efflux system protein